VRDSLLKALEGWNADDLHRVMLQGEAARKALEVLKREGDRDGYNPQEALNDTRAGLAVAPASVDAELGSGENRTEKVAILGDLLTGQPHEHAAPDRTIKAQVEAWLKVLQGAVATDTLSEGRYDAYARHIGIFRDWIGPEACIELLTAPKLEEWWAHLTVLIREQRCSPAYAKTIFMTTRQFISRLAELGLIPLPGNLRSRRFKFNDGPKRIETFTVDEVKALLKGCDGFSERTKLYLLLMLNCGMYQNDIAELGRGEVDWKEGTITRPRSKTPGGPVVRYKLWPQTFDLLKKHKAKVEVLNDRDQPRALLTERNRPLVGYWMEEGRIRRYGIIQSAWTRLLARVKVGKPMKVFRKTSATLLGQHPQFKYYSVNADREVQRRADPKVQRSGSG
jgi:integrase